MEVVIILLYFAIILFFFKQMAKLEKELFEAHSFSFELLETIMKKDRENIILRRKLNNIDTKVGCIKQNLGGE